MFYNCLKRQCDNYALDFEDLINFTLYILEKNEDVRIRWQEKCQYVFKIVNITQTYEIQFRNIRGTRRIMFRAELEKVSQPD